MSGYTEKGDCGAISPDMADPCRNERGHLDAHWALCGEMWERTEPEGLGKMKQVRVPKGTVIYYRLPPEWWEYGHAAFSYRSERAQPPPCPPPTWKQRALRRLPVWRLHWPYE